MKRLRELVRAAGDAALQLTLPLFDAPPSTPPRAPARPLGPEAPPRDPLARTAPPAVEPRAAPPALGRRVARLGEHAVEYELRRSRRRTIGFYVDDTGLRVTAPRWVTLTEIDAALADKERWILRKLVEWRDHAQRRERLAVRWEDGGTVAYLGRDLTMRVHAGPASIALEGEVLRVALPPDAGEAPLRDVVQAWLQARAREVFAERLPVYTERLGRGPTRWRLSSARTRWGSCAPDGSIRLNWRLVHFPIEIVDYVIAHELAHLNEMNHGPRFWATVQTLLPEFESARSRLKDFPDNLTLS
ncbi:MAG: YgjP-like metallopeptidase domain-containing protein [Burkholderiales bacterium]|jgi:predicted metal-dependent hydrolase